MKVNFEKIANQHKYCFICGQKISWKGRNLLVCTNCNYNKYINPTPCNAAIIENSEGEILLVKRSVDPKKGFWDLPGGFVDLNETMEESIKREIKEELGADLHDLKYITSKHDLYTFDGIEFPTLGFIFSGSIGNQKITPTDDISDASFFKKNKIPFNKIAFDSLKEVLKEYV